MKKKIIVAPLHWGLGHATRCVPIINILLANNYLPIIASDGNALSFLSQEFPDLVCLKLPSYNITYSKNLKRDLLFKLPTILKAVSTEKKIIHRYILQNKDVVGIISDNRFGVRSKLVISVYITHQIRVLSGATTFISSFFHQKIIKKFDECWIPDNANSQFSGKLSKSTKKINAKFIGVLSRFKKENIAKDIDVLILLSGPEPNRTFLENKLITLFKNDGRTIVFVLGKVEDNQKKWTKGNTIFYNYLLSKELENVINRSKIVVCRSGYSSIMDLAVLQKKAFFIPTKNQPEQEYLAQFLKAQKLAPFKDIINFSKENLSETENYQGLKTEVSKINPDLFSLFKRK